MADRNGECHVIEESQVRQNKPHSESGTSRYLNGQCVLAMPSGSILNPGFDLEQCRSRLELSGFQIPESDLEVPLKTALHVPSVKRYITLNSSLFHFLMAPVLYVILWCAVFSSLHSFLTVTDYWVLCLCVSLVSIFVTTAIIFTLQYSNKEIDLNLDVRLIAVNERLVKHKLLVAVADWVENCTSNMQLYFVFWDMSRCLRALTEAFVEGSYEAHNIQKKLQRRMSHLVLVSKPPLTPSDSGTSHTETQEGDVERVADEHTSLLQNQEPERCPSSGHQGAHHLTTNFSLIPDPGLPAQDRAQWLLLVYSALYVKLLVSERLSGPSHYRMRPRRNHCSTASLCLCQFIRTKILR